MTTRPSASPPLETLLGDLHRNLESNNIEEIRKCYRSLMGELPTSSLIWHSWMQYEWRQEAYQDLEKLFSEALRPHGDVRMWRLYLQYVRAGHATEAPTEGDSSDAVLLQRKTMLKAYELALSHVGLDLESLPIYREYIDFLQSWRTTSLYEQQVQMDALRKVYHRALATPLEGIESIWQQYDAWENALSKLTAKKMLTDKSASYMAARAAGKELRAMFAMNGLDRDSYALPIANDPVLAARKYAAWFRWIEWEKRNPLNLPDKSPVLLQRIHYAYKGVISVLWHYPEAWYDYSSWLLSTGKVDEAETQLSLAIKVLSEDLLVNLAYVDLLESRADGTEEEQAERKAKITAVYERLVAHLDETPQAEGEEASPALPANVNGTRKLTLTYIQYMNYCRRADGIASARAVFTRARKSPHVTHQLYVAAAQMEYHFKKDPAIAGRIYELGMGRFATSPDYSLSYLHFLLQINDEQNARALFERVISTLPAEEALEVWKTFLDHAFRYSDSTTIGKLTSRFQTTYPGQPIARDITVFLRKYSGEGVDLATEYERLWLDASNDSPLPLSAAERKLLKPFYIPDTVNSLIEKLPISSFEGPLIDPDGILKLLQVVTLSSGNGAPPSGHHPPITRSSRSTNSNNSTSSGTRGRPKRQRSSRLFDPKEEGRQEATNAPLRADDIFAVRRSTRSHNQ